MGAAGRAALAKSGRGKSSQNQPGHPKSRANWLVAGPKPTQLCIFALSFDGFPAPLPSPPAPPACSSTLSFPPTTRQQSIALVLAEIPAGLVQEVIVVDNNSSDNTGATARAAGATVLREPRPGYGYACLAGMAHCLRPAPKPSRPDIVVFLDGDHSDFPADMTALAAAHSCAARPTW